MLIISIIGVYLAFKLAFFYLPFLIAFIISLLLEPLIRFLMVKCKVKRKTHAFYCSTIIHPGQRQKKSRIILVSTLPTQFHHCVPVGEVDRPDGCNGRNLPLFHRSDPAHYPDHAGSDLLRCVAAFRRHRGGRACAVLYPDLPHLFQRAVLLCGGHYLAVPPGDARHEVQLLLRMALCTVFGAGFRCYQSALW